MHDPTSSLMLFDYAGPAGGRGYERWIEEVCRCLFQFDFSPRGDMLDCHLRATVLPHAVLGTIVTAPTRIYSDDASGRDDIVFLFAPTARCLGHGKRGPIEISSRQGLLLERNGSAFELLGRGQAHTLHIPRAALLSRLPRGEDLLSRPLPDNAPAATLIKRYFETAFDIVSEGLDPNGQQMIADHLVARHSDFDGLIPSHCRMGKFSAGSSSSMLLGTPG